MLIAITRDVAPSIVQCELTHLDRQPIDFARAQAQHLAYRRCLTSLGVLVKNLPSDENLADAVFTEDPSVVVDELAVLTRMAALSRRPELAAMREALSMYRSLRELEAPAQLDGGDVLQIGRTLYVGITSRTNREGIEQLAALVEPHRYVVKAVETRDCLHLKTGISDLGRNTLLVNPKWVNLAAFASYQLIEVDPSEPFAANALKIGNTVIYPSSFPKTAARLAERGFELMTVDISELQKAEAGVTCLSKIFSA